MSDAAKEGAIAATKTFFGATVGALVDLGMTDDEVIATCQFVLDSIRCAMANHGREIEGHANAIIDAARPVK
jgi:hypothetical protein